ncbi:S41 family peptidase [Mucilaginibacter lappiensis]|jgi:hypothetical protein|uniref:S41 family peptidase n=1 Tax=Mucilaginibacter lappiensis TaxID=354630 RepID=UPI003D1FFAAE
MKNILTLIITLTLLGPQSCIAQKKVILNPKQVKMVIDTLGKNLISYYVFPDKALKIDEYIKTQYKKGTYKNITDPQELADKLYADIKLVHFDPHMGVSYNPDFEKQHAKEKNAPQKSTDSIAELNRLKETNFNFKKMEILSGNVGYLQFNQFVADIKNAKPILAAAFTFLSNTKALIIDLRYNGGGDIDMVSQIESYFFKQKTHMNDVVNRLGNDTTLLYADPKKADGLTLSMPVYILTSKRTFSGAEDFSYAMQSVKRATIVGDTTGGGAHPVNTFSITNGLVAFIPFARSLNPYTHTDWEGTGVIPDIAVPSTNALEKALETIYTNQLKSAKNNDEKKAIEWQLHRLNVYHYLKIDAKTLEQYTGTYNSGGLNFYVKNGALYCKNKQGKNYTFELVPISSSVFTWGENTELEAEFIKDTNGNFISIHILGPNGILATMNRDN